VFPCVPCGKDFDVFITKKTIGDHRRDSPRL
jgi:hypothetical protein